MASLENLIQGIKDYRDHNLRVDNFLTACLENDLQKAVSYADGTSLYHIRELIQHMNTLPPESWGSPDKVYAWLHRGDHCPSGQWPEPMKFICRATRQWPSGRPSECSLEFAKLPDLIEHVQRVHGAR